MLFDEMSHYYITHACSSIVHLHWLYTQLSLTHSCKDEAYSYFLHRRKMSTTIIYTVYTHFRIFLP